MKKYILSKKVIKNVFAKNTYKSLIIFYSFYILFSPQAFALTVEAPIGGESFKQITLNGVTVDESKKSLQESRTEKIRLYYARHNLPLQSEAKHFVLAAEKYDIDWRLVAAIGFIESTGGKFACSTASYSAFGWGSCKINFDSYAESIDIISKNLGGYNPNTERYYADKNIRGILEAYNPPSIVPDYADKVMKQMAIIDNQ